MAHIKTYARLKPTKKVYPGYEVDGSTLRIHIVDNKEYPAIDPQLASRGHLLYEVTFTGIFNPASTQEDIFNVAARDIIQNFLNGYNGTIFAYGQTGTGKTYTVEGNSYHVDSGGLSTRALSMIYQHLAQQTDAHFSVYLSYLEIYQEVAYDLLNPTCRPPVPIFQFAKHVNVCEGSQESTMLRGLTLHLAANEEVAQMLLLQGQANRKIAETPTNQRSSRSHAVFTVYLQARRYDSKETLKSKLHLVDLAGSERVSKTGADGQQLTEAKSINLSLHHLETVIVALQSERVLITNSIVGEDRSMDDNVPSESRSALSVTSLASSDGGRPSRFVPYRNSLLTMLLKDSLGGNCLTAMIATISMEAENVGESVSTCRFAQRVARVANNARRNEEIDDKALISRLREKISCMKQELVSIKSQGEWKSLYSCDDISTTLSLEDRVQCAKIMDGFLQGKITDLVAAGVCDQYRLLECLHLLKERCRESQTALSQLLTGQRLITNSPGLLSDTECCQDCNSDERGAGAQASQSHTVVYEKPADFTPSEGSMDVSEEFYSASDYNTLCVSNSVTDCCALEWKNIESRSSPETHSEEQYTYPCMRLKLTTGKNLEQAARKPEQEHQIARKPEQEHQPVRKPEQEHQPGRKPEQEQQTGRKPEQEQQTVRKLEEEQQTARKPEQEHQPVEKPEQEHQHARKPEQERQAAKKPDKKHQHASRVEQEHQPARKPEQVHQAGQESIEQMKRDMQYERLVQTENSFRLKLKVLEQQVAHHQAYIQWLKSNQANPSHIAKELHLEKNHLKCQARFQDKLNKLLEKKAKLISTLSSDKQKSPFVRQCCQKSPHSDRSPCRIKCATSEKHTLRTGNDKSTLRAKDLTFNVTSSLDTCGDVTCLSPLHSNHQLTKNVSALQHTDNDLSTTISTDYSSQILRQKIPKVSIQHVEPELRLYPTISRQHSGQELQQRSPQKSNQQVAQKQHKQATVARQDLLQKMPKVATKAVDKEQHKYPRVFIHNADQHKQIPAISKQQSEKQINQRISNHIADLQQKTARISKPADREWLELTPETTKQQGSQELQQMIADSQKQRVIQELQQKILSKKIDHELQKNIPSIEIDDELYQNIPSIEIDDELHQNIPSKDIDHEQQNIPSKEIDDEQQKMHSKQQAIHEVQMTQEILKPRSSQELQQKILPKQNTGKEVQQKIKTFQLSSPELQQRFPKITKLFADQQSLQNARITRQLFDRTVQQNTQKIPRHPLDQTRQQDNQKVPQKVAILEPQSVSETSSNSTRTVAQSSAKQLQEKAVTTNRPWGDHKFTISLVVGNTERNPEESSTEESQSTEKQVKPIEDFLVID